jgi:hypothetical protein
MAGFISSTVSAVPNVVGLTRTNANLLITNRRLVVGTQTATNTENSGIDQQVISQSPVSGTGVAIGSSVNYNYYQYVAPPFFPYFPPPFFPFFPYFPPPFFPFFPFFPTFNPGGTCSNQNSFGSVLYCTCTISGATCAEVCTGAGCG